MPESASTITPLTADESRTQQRTHLFVAATLYVEGSSSPVRIRNMSPTGALIEGEDLPDPGAAATLKRGTLRETGCVVWKAGSRAGVSFSSTIHVADWMSRIPPPHQARVDEAVRNIRSGVKEIMSRLEDPKTGVAGSAIDTELETLICELSELEAGLVSDVVLISTHPEIQLLDVARQRAERILSLLRGR